MLRSTLVSPGPPFGRPNTAPCEPIALEQDLEGDVLGAAALEEVDRPVEIDVGGGCEQRRRAQLVPGPLADCALPSTFFVRTLTAALL